MNYLSLSLSLLCVLLDSCLFRATSSNALVTSSDALVASSDALVTSSLHVFSFFRFRLPWT